MKWSCAVATEGEMAISTTAFIGWHSPADVLFPAHLLGDNPQIHNKWRYFWNTIQEIGDNFGIRI